MAIIDAHAYIGNSLFGYEQSAEELLHLMDRCGIDKAVLCPSRPREYHLWPANQMVALTVEKHPDRFYGLARVDPWQGKLALEDLIHAREDLGLHGLLLHPWEESFQIASPLVDPLVSCAAEQKMPIFVETGYALVSHPLDVAELAARYPEVNFIGTHGLQLDSSAFALVDAERAMRDCDNLIMETSGMYASEVMENLVHELGETRLIFGSHSPWLDLELELERVKLLNLRGDQLDAILGGNIKRILSDS